PRGRKPDPMRSSTAATREVLVRRVTAGLVAIAIVGAGCVPEPPPLDDPVVFDDTQLADFSEFEAQAIVRRAEQITVRIRTLGCRQFGIGSGFVLPGGIVVTNRHVVDEPRSVTVNTWDGQTLEASVEGVAVDSDLAILRLQDDIVLPVAELRDEPVRRDEPIVVVGYPGGGPATVTTGKVVGLVSGEMLGEPADVIRIDAEIRQGNSGGPVLDQQGRVVGVVFALEAERGTGLAVPVATLLERLHGAAMAPPAGC
ncbi:MAG: serine protease, partial [Nitriliruptoraceae bacterium]